MTWRTHDITFSTTNSGSRPRNNPVLLTEAPLNTKACNVQRGRHERGDPGCFVSVASRRTTDTVMTSGDGVSHHAILRLADRDLTEQGDSLTASAEREIARDVKQKPCYICLDLDTEHKSTTEIDKEQTYEPPDVNIVTVVPNVSRKCCSSHTVPIYEGYVVHHAIPRLAGRDRADEDPHSARVLFRCHRRERHCM